MPAEETKQTAQIHEPPPQEEPQPASSSSLCAYMDELVETLRELVPAALKEFDEVSIHQARVATRRLKAAIDLLEPVLSDEHRKPFAKAGRQLRRRLGPLRDLDVMIGHLKIIQQRSTHRAAAHWLEQRLIDAREKAREDSASSRSPRSVLARMGNWWGLREEVIEAGDVTRSLLADALHRQLDSFAQQAELLGKKDAKIKQDPHEVRIAGKALRYTLEMAKREGHALPGGVAKAFKRMQDELGAWHDFVVLTERAMSESLDALLAHHDTQLQRQLLDLARSTLETARKDLDRFSALWAAEGPELLKTIRRAIPLAASPTTQRVESLPAVFEQTEATESKTDPDPSDLEAASNPEASPATDPEAA